MDVAAVQCRLCSSDAAQRASNVSTRTRMGRGSLCGFERTLLPRRRGVTISGGRRSGTTSDLGSNARCQPRRTNRASKAGVQRSLSYALTTAANGGAAFTIVAMLMPAKFECSMRGRLCRYAHTLSGN